MLCNMITKEMIVQRAKSILPAGAQLTGTLRKRAGADIDHNSTGTSWAVRRKGQQRTLTSIAGGMYAQVAQTYQLFQEAQTVTPEQGDELDADGDTWQLSDVRVSQLEGVFDCECVRDVPTSTAG